MLLNRGSHTGNLWRRAVSALFLCSNQCIPSAFFSDVKQSFRKSAKVCFFLHLYWGIIALQWYISFCFITKWISYTYTYVPISLPSCVSLPPTLPIPPLQAVTKHRADLPVLCGCFPLAIYLTCSSLSSKCRGRILFSEYCSAPRRCSNICWINNLEKTVRIRQEAKIGGREGDTRGKRYGNICICITDSLCYKSETNT